MTAASCFKPKTKQKRGGIFETRVKLRRRYNFMRNQDKIKLLAWIDPCSTAVTALLQGICSDNICISASSPLSLPSKYITYFLKRNPKSVYEDIRSSPLSTILPVLPIPDGASAPPAPPSAPAPPLVVAHGMGDSCTFCFLPRFVLFFLPLFVLFF